MMKFTYTAHSTKEDVTNNFTRKSEKEENMVHIDNSICIYKTSKNV